MVLAQMFQDIQMQGIFFNPFPKYNKDAENYKGWIQACSRQGFDISSMTKYTYVCSAHSVEANRPSDELPDPSYSSSSYLRLGKYLFHILILTFEEKLS